MDWALSLQIKPPDKEMPEDAHSAQKALPQYLLKDKLNLICRKNRLYLLQDEQEVLLKTDDTIGIENLVFTVQLQEEKVIDVLSASAVEEVVQHDAVISEAAFALAELNRENTCSELDTLMYAYDKHDPLAFLFASKTSSDAQQKINSKLTVLSHRKDSLALLNEYFQPPQATWSDKKITAIQPTDMFANNEFDSVEGDILRDLGFLAEMPQFDYKPLSLLQISLTQLTHIDYRDEIDQS